MRILITGGRNWNNYKQIKQAIAFTLLVNGSDPAEVTLIHGNARGADLLGAEAAEGLGLNIEVHPARWDIYGRGAGPIRNQEMVDSGADLCLAFLMPGSTGTADCIRRARKAGIPVIIHNLDGTIEDEIQAMGINNV